MDQAFAAALIGAIATVVVLGIFIVFRKPATCAKCGAEQPKFARRKT